LVVENSSCLQIGEASTRSRNQQSFLSKRESCEEGNIEIGGTMWTASPAIQRWLVPGI